MRRRPPDPATPGPAGARRARLLVVAGLLAALGGWLLVRDAPVVAVDRVEVRGATGPDAPAIRSALAASARRMTTLHVDGDELRAAVARFPTVAGVDVDRDLPDRLVVSVRERESVGVLAVAGGRVPVDAEGRLLTGATPPDDLPAIADGRARERLVELLAAAPEPLRRRGRRAYLGAEGLTVAMHAGPSLYFGRGRRLEAKWAAAARVLADPASEGARYIDVTVPERPAAGGVVPSSAASGLAVPSDPPAQVEVQG